MLNYEQSRKIFVNLIGIFENKSPKKEKITVFEKDIIQVINYKSEINFELFIELFDLLINYGEEYNDDYTTQNVIDLFHESKKSKRDKKRRVNKEIIITEYDDYEQTVGLVIRTYNFFRRNFSRSSHENEKFDIFLSHKYNNKYFNLIVFYILRYYYDLNVYVDWIHDRKTNRSRLSSNTVDLLSKRLNQSCSLLFFNMEHTKTTNWMVWEIGYFTGKDKNSVGVLDLSNYYGKNKTSVEVLSSGHRFIYDSIDIVDDSSIKTIDMVFNCEKGAEK